MTNDQNNVSSHGLKVVLVEPEIPQNAGNVGRLCAATGAELHLVRPLGFILSDRHFKRAGMDYLRDVKMTAHEDLGALMRVVAERGGAVVMTSGVRGEAHWDVKYERGMWLFFGKESAGLPEGLMAGRTVARIPMVEETRGLNLATAAGVVVYEAIRQVCFK